MRFNFHQAANGVQSRTLWNPGGRSFLGETAGIGAREGVDQAELIDVDGRPDLFAPDRRDNIRGTWNGTRFVKR